MDQLLKQSTAATVKVGPFVDDTDGKTAETGLTIAQADIRLSKNGGAFAQTNNSAGATHDENGYYGVPLDATDTGTLGRLRVAISESGALPVVHDFLVVPAAVYDSLVAGSDKLPVDVQEVSSDSTAADNLEAACDGTGYNLGGGSVVAASVSGAVGSVTGNVGGNVSGSVGSISGVTFPTHFEDLSITDTDGHVTAGTVSDKTGYSLAADQSGVTIGTVNTLTGHTAQTGDSFARLGAPAGASVSADVAAVKTDTGNLVTRITSTLFSGITSLAEWLGLIAGKQTGDATARTELRGTGAGSGTFDETADSLEAVRDRGDSAWPTATGFSTFDPASDKVYLGDGAHGGSSASFTLADYSDFQGAGASLTAEDIWTYGTRTLSAFAFTPTVDVTQIDGNAISGTGSQLADGFSYWFDVASPAKTMNDAGVAGSGLSQQDVRDALQLAATSDDPAAGSPDKHLDDILAKTNLIGSVNVEVTSPVSASGEVEIVAGSDYDADQGRALEWSYTTTVDHTDATATLQVLATSDYLAGTGTWASLGTVTVAVSGGTATVTAELTAEQTAALSTAPALDEANYTYHLRVSASGGNTIHDVIGALTVLRSLDG